MAEPIKATTIGLFPIADTFKATDGNPLASDKFNKRVPSARLFGN